MATKSAYRWTRDLHLYLGLFASPIILVFALSVISLNHTYLPWGGDNPDTSVTTHAITSAPAASDLELAKSIQEQVDIPGEIDFIDRNDEELTLAFPVTAPGYRAIVRADLKAGVARVTETQTGVWDAMNYLHKMPGPHNVSVRGNWFATRAWGWMADATVYLLLFVSASGVYLWSALRAERRTGLLFLGAGALSFVLLVLAITG